MAGSSPPDDDSSEESVTHTGHEDHNSRLFHSPSRSSLHQRQWGQRQTVQEALQMQATRWYVGIHPDHDFGTLPHGKNSDMVHLGYCNVAGIPAKVSSNNKVNAIRKYACKNDLDGFFGTEANINWKGMPGEGQLPILFHSENAIWMVTSYNTFENFGHKQQGSTFGLAFRQLVTKVQDVGSDALGRWSWMLFWGCDGHCMQVIVAYQPCHSNNLQVGTIYQQHKWQQVHNGCPDLCPHQKFHNDLIQLLQQWRQVQDHLILFIDANENTTNGPLHSALTGPRLLMREGVWLLHPLLPATPTFMAGSHSGSFLIDATYLSPDLPLK